MFAIISFIIIKNTYFLLIKISASAVISSAPVIRREPAKPAEIGPTVVTAAPQLSLLQETVKVSRTFIIRIIRTNKLVLYVCIY